MKVRETPLPEGTLLAGLVAPQDFVDCYAGETPLDVETVVARATEFPAWVKGLLLLRALAVLPFKLKGRSTSGDRFGIFPVAGRAKDEILLGFDDRHLDFRISVLCRDNIAYAATWVRPHNLFGRVYLRLILPFHRWIMRDAVARAVTG
ncbi:MAG: DUF2867 domain-containing protein [Rhizobiaceae bacterium]|nr:DUF2867 domain-containing protein [Rhizobiaceae bacterium]